MAFLLPFFLISSSSIDNASHNSSEPYSSRYPDMITNIEPHVRIVVYEHGILTPQPGCDYFVVLDDMAEMIGEKSASQNLISLCGFEVVDDVMAALEAACPSNVSCANIL
ncbi:hypothetical protein ACFX13_033793 [Malus domestica]